MDALSVAAWAVGVMAALIAVRYGLVLWTLRRLRLAAPTVPERIERAALPPAHAELLALAAPRLEALGFTFEFAARAPAALVTRSPCPSYSTSWRHAASGAWAVVQLHDQPEFAQLYLVSFYSFYASPPHLFTVARRAHELVLVHPDFAIVDSGRDLAHQWQCHLERMAARATDELITDTETIDDIEGRGPERLRAAMADDDSFVLHADGSAQLTWRGAWRYMRRYLAGARSLRGQPVAAADANGIAAHDPRAEQLRANADAIALGAALGAERVDTGRRYKALLLLGTGVASLLLFGWRFDWLFAALLVAVLLLHELGHLAAMRWAGYRDLKIFFIPFIGAMASGREQRASAWQKMLVLLAGPLPGIVLGSALLHGLASHLLPPSAWLVSAASLLIVINLFNLLPLVPLDGGRFFDELLVARLPRWRGAFACLGAAGLVAVGVWLAEPVIAALGGVLLLGVPAAWRQAHLLAALRIQHPQGCDEDGAWLAAFAHLMVEAPYAGLPYARRQVLARSITASSLAPPPSVAAVLTGLALYVSALALPAWVFAEHGVDIIGAVAARFDSAAPPRAEIPLDTQLAAAPDAAARLALTLRAAGEAEDGEDYARAHDYYRRALAMSATVDNSQAQRVDATLGMVRNADQPAALRAELETLLASLTAQDRATRLQRARVLFALCQEFSDATRREDTARLAEVVATRAELSSADDFDLLNARQALAWQLWRDGQAEQAMAQLSTRLDAVLAACRPRCAPEQAWLRTQTYLDAGWLLLAMGKTAAAAQLVEDAGQALSKLDAGAFSDDERVAVLHAWILSAAGDQDGAARVLRAANERLDVSSGAFDQLQNAIDLAIFAERGGDPRAVQARHDEFTATVAALRKTHPGLTLAWLQSSLGSPYLWHRPRLEAEIAWLEKHRPSLLDATAR